MKKIMILLLTICVIVLPFNVSASTEALNLVDTLETAGIDITFGDYEETDDQVTVYLFWWSSCSHCHALLEYLESITEEYGYMFKLRSYEVTSNEDNSTLKDEVVEFLDQEAPGVPFLVIGSNSWYGYSEDFDDDILTAIETEYESDEKYDVLEALANQEETEEDKKNENDALYVLIPILIIVLIYFVVKSCKSDAKSSETDEKETKTKKTNETNKSSKKKSSTK